MPIPKKSSATKASTIRPISLLSIVSKVLERHVHTLIMDHLHNHHPLSEFQWGFQPGKSTVTALLSTTHSWLTSLPLIIQTETITQNGFSLGENFPVDP